MLHSIPSRCDHDARSTSCEGLAKECTRRLDVSREMRAHGKGRRDGEGGEEKGEGESTPFPVVVGPQALERPRCKSCMY